MKADNIELLNEIAAFEDSQGMEKEFKIGWGWRHVRMWPAQRRLKLDSGTWSPKGGRQVLLIDELGFGGDEGQVLINRDELRGVISALRRAKEPVAVA